MADAGRIRRRFGQKRSKTVRSQADLAGKRRSHELERAGPSPTRGRRRFPGRMRSHNLVVSGSSAMDRKKASDFPQELLDLFDAYVHGGVSRRAFLEGAQRLAAGGLSAAALFEMLRPNYAWAIQVPPDDSRITAKRVSVPSPDGNGSIKGYLVRPANADKLPAVLVVHENRGLNPYIEDVARRLALANFIAFAPDGLTSVGGYPGDDEKGATQFAQVDRAKMT